MSEPRDECVSPLVCCDARDPRVHRHGTLYGNGPGRAIELQGVRAGRHPGRYGCVAAGDDWLIREAAAAPDATDD